jgi:hypothetical protein
MKSVKIYLSLIISLVLFASCEKDVEFKGTMTKSALVVNSFVSPDSVVSANVSESKFFLEEESTITGIENATVSVYVNGTFKEKMIHTDKGNYRGTYIPTIGEIIKLVVTVPTKTDVSCQDKVLTRPELISIDTTVTFVHAYYNIVMRDIVNNDGSKVYVYDTLSKQAYSDYEFKIKMKDNGSEKNYYRLTVLRKYTYTDGTVYYGDPQISENIDPQAYSSDPLQTGDDSNPFCVFSDDIINGKEYTMKFKLSESTTEYYDKSTESKTELIIALQQISKDYYLYLRTRAAANEDDVFSEPVQIHCNIKNGLGVFGSYSSSVRIMRL